MVVSVNLSVVITFAAVFFLSTLAYSRIPFHAPQNKVTLDDFIAESPANDSEREVESESKLPQSKTKESTVGDKIKPEEGTATLPIAVITFHPINRPFARGSLRTLRLAPHKHRVKLWDPSIDRHVVPLEKDATMLGNQGFDFDSVTGGYLHRYPSRWTSRYSYVSGRKTRKQKERGHDENSRSREEGTEWKGTGGELYMTQNAIIRRVRKFLGR